MNIGKLATELAKPIYTRLSDIEARDVLNAETIDSNQPITSAELLAWAGKDGRYARIATAADNTTLPDEVRSVAMAARKLIDRDSTVLDLSLTDRAAMLDALVQASILTADDRESLYSCGTVKISRAAELGFGKIKRGYIQRARARLATEEATDG